MLVTRHFSLPLWHLNLMFGLAIPTDLACAVHSCVVLFFSTQYRSRGNTRWHADVHVHKCLCIIGFCVHGADNYITRISNDNICIPYQHQGFKLIVIMNWCTNPFWFQLRPRMRMKPWHYPCKGDSAGYISMIYKTKSRLAIRVLNYCRPHVNTKLLNDIRESANQTMWYQWVCSIRGWWADKPSIVAFTGAAD